MSMRLLVLGLLMERDRHPYDIRQTIKQRNWNEAFKLRDGSLYYAVDQMREEGLIEAAEVIPVPGDNRPDKTIYRITARGREAFLDLLYEQFGQAQPPIHPFFPGLPFVRHGESAKIADLTRRQLEACECRIERLKAVIQLKKEHLPRGAVHLLTGMVRFSETERDWLSELLADAESGKLEDACWTPECLGDLQRETQPPRTRKSTDA